MPTTGRELKTLRVLSGVTIKGLLDELGVSRTTLWTIEKAPIVKPETAAQYRDAVARLMQSGDK